MSNEESTTLKNILSAGKAEFLEKDFNSASLRNIVKTAGVTTGAFYGYFSGKEALFAALVEEHAKAIMNIFMFKKYCYENNFTFVYFVYVPAMCSSGQGKG